VKYIGAAVGAGKFRITPVSLPDRFLPKRLEGLIWIVVHLEDIVSLTEWTSLPVESSGVDVASVYRLVFSSPFRLLPRKGRRAMGCQS
jgi:hypothetical protein